MNTKFIFSDIDSIIWPEIPVLFSIAKALYPKRKNLNINMLTTYTVKSEQNTPPLLTRQEVQNIFEQYYKLRIFKEPLEKLNTYLNRHFKENFSIDISKYINNIEYLNKHKDNSDLTFLTSRNNYKKEKLIKDTKRFLKYYELGSNLFFTSQYKNKGDIIIDRIRKRQCKKIDIIEDNLRHMLNILISLEKERINNFRFIIINYPWNMTKHTQKRYNIAHSDESEYIEIIKKLKIENKFIRLNQLEDLKKLS